MSAACAQALSTVRVACAVALSTVCVSAFAQPGYTTENKRAIKLYESGGDCMRQQDWSCAERDLKKAAELDPKFLEPRIYLAEMYEEMDKPNEAMALWGEVIAISPRYFTPAMLNLADLEFAAQKYAEADKHYKEFITLDNDQVRKDRALLGIAKCAFASEAVKHPVPFDPKNLGPAVNTKAPEYFPCVTADDGTLIFTRRVEDKEALDGFAEQEDFFQSDRGTDGLWGTATPIPGVDTKRNEGAGTLSPDGRFIIFTKCSGADGSYGEGYRGVGDCDLFISRRIGKRWSKPENLGRPLNSPAWESQPSLGSDGRTLYFVHGRRTGHGISGMDIFVSQLGEDGAFGKPEKLGDVINTPLQEESPQIHPDGRTLYFSSDGHPGMGGLDIFVSRKKADGTWGRPENLGYPINTNDDENSVLVGSNGEVAYFASDRPGGQGDLDLYQFEVPQAARANAVSYIRGKVHDKNTNKPVEADVQLYDLSTGELATGAYSDPQSGEFLVCLPSGRDYALNAGAEGYLFFSQNYSIANNNGNSPVTLDVPLSPLTTGSVIDLRNIFFNTGSAELLPASNTELDKLVKLLQANPTLRIELGGHTDNIGDDTSNQILSQQRANAVRDFATAKGIDAARITAKGYGETKPVDTNDTEEGRARNRRTEVTVL